MEKFEKGLGENRYNKKKVIELCVKLTVDLEIAVAFESESFVRVFAVCSNCCMCQRPALTAGYKCCFNCVNGV